MTEVDLHMAELAGIFERIPVAHQTVAFGERRPLVCSAALKLRVLCDLKITCEKLYRECKNGPHPKTIHTKIIGSRRLSEPNSFFGTDMVVWLVDNNWSDNIQGATLLCSDIMFTNKIIQPVYPFIKKFVSDRVLYKFTRDTKDSEDAMPRRESTYKIAKDICVRRIQEQARKRRPSSNTSDQDPLSTSPQSSTGSFKFRRSSSSGSSTPTGDTDTGGAVYIAGNMLLSMIDKGCDGLLTCQLMLRYGYISPVFNDSITSADMSLKQVFYAQEKYKFSDLIIRSVNRLATIGTARTRKQSTVLAAIDRRLSVTGITPDLVNLQKGVYENQCRLVHHVLEKVQNSAGQLEKPSLFCSQTLPREPTLDETGVIHRGSATVGRRFSSVTPARNTRPSFLQKLRKTSK